MYVRVCATNEENHKLYKIAVTFLGAVREVADDFDDVIDGTDCVIRTIDTFTTHLEKAR